MAIRTLYGFDEDGNKIAVGSYDPKVIVTINVKNTMNETLTNSVITGAGIYNPGDTVTLTAETYCGSANHFYGWQYAGTASVLDVFSEANPYTFTATTNVSITAIYWNGPM